MRTYELLWRLPSQTLAIGNVDARINSDAQLCTRLIRNYSKDWVDGAGRFAALYLPYLLEEDEAAKARKQQAPWNDTQDAGKGGLPAGLTEIEDDEAIRRHSSRARSRISRASLEAPSLRRQATAQDRRWGDRKKSQKEYRGPVEYAEILKAAGTDLPKK